MISIHFAVNESHVGRQVVLYTYTKCEMSSGRGENDYSSSSARESFSVASFLTKAERTLDLILISSSFWDPRVPFARIDSSLSK